MGAVGSSTADGHPETNGNVGVRPMCACSSCGDTPTERPGGKHERKLGLAELNTLLMFFDKDGDGRVDLAELLAAKELPDNLKNRNLRFDADLREQVRCHGVSGHCSQLTSPTIQPIQSSFSL